MAGARHGTGTLDPSRPTPGMRIELVALAPVAPANSARYRLRAEGVPISAGYGIWVKNFATSDFKEVVPGFKFQDGTLTLVDGSGKRKRLDEVVLEPGPYAKGAAWTVALASDDHKLAAFTRVVPYPIVAKDRACAVWLELASAHGDRFITTGTGFIPGEIVDMELRYSGRVTHKKQRAAGDGTLPADLLSLGATNPDPIARLVVKAATCEPAIEYEWGEAGLKKR
jgi:hypothetical protein